MRLSASAMGRLPVGVARADYDRAAQRSGIVHLGIGAFHRAHQAVYTDRAMAAGDRDWAITGVSLRSPDVRDTLVPQDGLYTVSERSAAGTTSSLIGALKTVLVAPERPDAVIRALAAQDTRILTFTVTEKGYHIRPDRTLDIGSASSSAQSIYPYLAGAFADRKAAGLPGLTLICCDNLGANGELLAGAITSWLDRFAPDLCDWFAAECACPSTMVDRIVPATIGADRDMVAATIGMRDEAAVVTEPYSQWVIEDRFAGPRPRWELAGAQLVSDVRPYETAKLRMLNGAHSALAYLGLLAGHAHVHEAIADPAIGATIERLMRIEAAASLDEAAGFDASAYAGLLLMRFANPALPHRLAQIATDGSQKIVQRWLEPLAINNVQSRHCPATLEALAAWMIHVRGDGYPVADPLAVRLAECWATAGCEMIVDALFSDTGIFAGGWQPTSEDRMILQQALTRLDQRKHRERCAKGK